MKIVILTTDNREAHKNYHLPEPYFGTAPEALLQGFEELPEVEVHVISCVRQEMTSPEKIAPNIYYHPLLVPKIGWMTTAYQGCIRATRSKIAEIQPDIVHGQGTEREAAVCAVFSGYPNVLTLHGNIRTIARLNKVPAFSYLWLNAYLEGFLLPRTAGIVCITDYTRQEVSDCNQRTWIVPNAVDRRFYDIDAEADPLPHLYVVGNICLRKNQNALIRALAPVAEKHPFRLIFLGDGGDGDFPYAVEFAELIRQHPFAEWHGFADRPSLREKLSRAAGLILPSLEDNCPMVVLEAMAAGVPVIAANVGGVPDLVQDGVNGQLCDPLNAESMAGAVRRLLEQPEEITAMARTAKEQALVRYSPKRIAERHVEIYREVLSDYRL